MKTILTIFFLLTRTVQAGIWDEAYDSETYEYKKSYIEEKKEFTIVSIGDSYASGEGLPDKQARLSAIGRNKCEAIKASKALDYMTPDSTGFLLNNLTFGATKSIKKPAEWLNLYAHRSLRSAPAIASLKGLVRRGIDLKFFTFAFSGAQTEYGLIKPRHYDWKPKTREDVDKEIRNFMGGIILNNKSYVKKLHIDAVRQNNSLASQLDLTSQTLGKKRIDALIISTGGNDIGFSQVLEAMYTRHGGSSKYEIRNSIRQLNYAKRKLKDLNLEISKKLNVNKIYITEYPARLFENSDGKIVDGCGFLDDFFMKVSTKEAREFQSVGYRLNKILKDTSEEMGWIYIGGIDDRFKAHGYCSKDSYFIGATESCKAQYDINGIMHPNKKGTKVIAEQIEKTLYNNLKGEKAARIISIL